MTDGVEQAGLSSWSGLQIVESIDRSSMSDPVRCPDCGQSISQTKGGQPLPEEIEASGTFGWRCGSCNNVVPCRAFNPEADGFNDRFRGLEVEFRDGHERFIPVLVGLEASTDVDGGEGPIADGGERADGVEHPEEGVELVRCTRGHTVKRSACTLIAGVPHCPLCQCRIQSSDAEGDLDE